MHCTALVVAGGSGSRLGRATPKQYLQLAGRPLLAWTLEAFERCAAIQSMVLVVAPSWVEPVAALLAPYRLDKLVRVCAGGQQRSDSVRAGLQALPAEAELVAIHDGARPLVSPELITRVVAAATDHGAALPVVLVPDTVKRVHGQQVEATVDRGPLRLAQTPQTFSVELIRRAYSELDLATRVTDDAQVVELSGHPVRPVEGHSDNIKVTVARDLERAARLLAPGEAAVRAGQGYDVHRLVPGRDLVLGGVNIPWPAGLLGHSDADVVLHAVGDALLGAAALGDLGAHFPADDPQYRGASSLDLLARVVGLVQQAGYRPSNVDATIVCQRPRLAPHIPAMRANLALVLNLHLHEVSVKATTTEGLGFTGRSEGVAAHAVVLIVTMP